MRKITLCPHCNRPLELRQEAERSKGRVAMIFVCPKHGAQRQGRIGYTEQ